MMMTMHVKHEIRNPKSERNSKLEIQMLQTSGFDSFAIFDLGHLCLFRASDFVLCAGRLEMFLS
jgi:hypothetical protein